MTGPGALAFSELRVLLTKAARGAGLPWGLAEEAGWAADWLARRGLPAAPWAADWLEEVLQGRQDPVSIGAALSDRLATAPAPLPVCELPDGLRGPGYLLPFLHLIALQHGPVEIRAGTGPAAVVGPDGAVEFGPGWSGCSAGWRLGPAAAPVAPAQPAAGRPQLTASLLECLETLALGTTVPPSARSRRDAGAALDDND